MSSKFRLIIEYHMKSNIAYFQTREQAESTQKLIKEAVDKAGLYNRDEKKTVEFEADNGAAFSVVVKDITATIIEDLDMIHKASEEASFEAARRSKAIVERAKEEGLSEYFKTNAVPV